MANPAAGPRTGKPAGSGFAAAARPLQPWGGGRSGQLLTKALPPTARDAAPQTPLPAASLRAAGRAHSRAATGTASEEVPRRRAPGPPRPLPLASAALTGRRLGAGTPARPAARSRSADTRGAGAARAPVERRHPLSPPPSRQPPSPERPSGTPSRAERRGARTGERRGPALWPEERLRQVELPMCEPWLPGFYAPVFWNSSLQGVARQFRFTSCLTHLPLTSAASTVTAAFLQVE
ncbi:uncharacterized protein LOC113458213 [Microtus ochrogaster]|uniref:Uncharacterized protein LOC113458213 n=1 Tax=Microtus ochrogaster TaxID=79684 RepID=A0ABM1URU8_MICOH|nr:uncharacterized protein LOC113458213 [Microtus ochrogaster]